jgi:hypothetical protein
MRKAWVEKVRSGDFSAIPASFSWDTSAQCACGLLPKLQYGDARAEAAGLEGVTHLIFQNRAKFLGGPSSRLNIKPRGSP